MKKTLWGLLAALCGVCVVVVLLVNSAQAITFNADFYRKTFLKVGSLAYSGMDEENIMKAGQTLIDYLSDKRDDIVVTAVVDGQQREVFNDREKAHMVDVKAIFTALNTLRYAALGVLLLAAALAVWRLKWKRTLKGFGLSLGVTGVAVLVLGGVFALFAQNPEAFDRIFYVFHTTFFSNDLWLLDPATDVMIRMLPQQFFLDCAVGILAVFLVQLLLYTAAGWVIYGVIKRKPKAREVAA